MQPRYIVLAQTISKMSNNKKTFIEHFLTRDYNAKSQKIEEAAREIQNLPGCT
jgi:hypothetical protein